jgi:hypothetical protein
MADEVLLKLGERTVAVPGLSLEQAARLWPEVCELNEGVGFSNLDTKLPAAIAVIHAAVQRVEPNITTEQIENDLSIADLRRVLIAIGDKTVWPKIAES